MANRLISPNPQFCDGTGLPYANGSLAFYASGTSTPLATYSDRALTIPNTNPVVLDASGRAGSVFLQNLAYKVILSDANSNPIWTMDPVYASDFSTTASFLSGNGSPNGSVAGSAGSATIPASAYWDATNNILYVCTQTGSTTTAVWTAVNASSAASITPSPQGYLTLTGGTPILPGDATNNSVYYTPYTGNTVPIYNGTSIVPVVFTEIAVALVSQHAANTAYDIFIFNNSGVLTLVTGPAWSSSAAGSSARGTGAGTTHLSRLNGLWVNTVSMTGRNGSTTYSIPANQGTYLGSMLVDATPGFVTCNRSFGQARKWGVWNAYNRQQIVMTAGDSTASWNYTTNVLRPSNNASGNYAAVFTGLAEETATGLFTQRASVGTTTLTAQVIANWQISIGLNSSSATAANCKVGWGGGRMDFGGNGDFTLQGDTTSYLNVAPSLGLNTLTCLEQTTAVNGSPSVNYQGQVSGMGLTVSYRG